MNLGAVIVTYNRLENLKITLEKSFAEVGLAEIIVVDNASNDGTSEYLKSLSNDRLSVVSLAENLGGAGGFNAGLDSVQNSTLDWVVLYDDDAYPDQGCIESFHNKYNNMASDVDGVAAAVYLANRDIAEMNRPFLNPFKNMFKKGKKSRVDNACYSSESVSEVDASTFVGFFVRVDAIKNYLGLPDKDLFIYADDLIYTNRIVQNHQSLLFDASLCFTHDCKTLQDNKDVYNPIWRVYYTYRNRIVFYKQISGWLYYPVVFSRIPLWLMKVFYYDSKTTFVRLFFYSVFDGLAGKRMPHKQLLEKIEL